MICLQGHAPGMHISIGQAGDEHEEELIEGDRDFALQAVRNGYVALALEQRCFGERAETLQEQGAKDVYAAAAHGVLVGPAVERLSAAPIKEVVVTDSIPLNDKAKMLGDQLRVLSVSELLGEAIRRIHTNQSISSLFVKK
jgi:2-keto-3-deoxy-galactonokinase